MSQMGLSDYCQDINDLKADRLIKQFCLLEKNTESLKRMITGKVKDCRNALDEQYSIIFGEVCPGREPLSALPERIATEPAQQRPFAKLAAGVPQAKK